jgi:hypothetical protein
VTQTYRTTDLAKWGVGKGSRLTASEVDNDFWGIIQRITTLEELPDAAAGIDHFVVSGTVFYVHMTDATILGPYDLPVATFRGRGDWTVSTAYSVLDTFTSNGSMYYVSFPHTSDATNFDPNANDGSGHDYYQLMIETPGSSLPTGGATGAVLEKSSGSNYAVTWGWKLPTGGTSREYLIKQSSTNQDADWGVPQADDIDFTPVSGSALTATNVADALEELSTSGGGGGGGGSVSDLSDVVFATGDPQFGSMLTFDSVSWVGTAEPVNGQVLRFDGSEWVPIDLKFSNIDNNLSIAQFRSASTSTNVSAGTIDPRVDNCFTCGVTTSTFTLNASSVAMLGEFTVIFYQLDGGTSITVTLGTNFKSTGTVALGSVAGKAIVMKFFCDGSSIFEISRTTAL